MAGVSLATAVSSSRVLPTTTANVRFIVVNPAEMANGALDLQRLAGRYDKIHPYIPEVVTDGITAGTEAPAGTCDAVVGMGGWQEYAVVGAAYALAEAGGVFAPDSARPLLALAGSPGEEQSSVMDALGMIGDARAAPVARREAQRKVVQDTVPVALTELRQYGVPTAPEEGQHQQQHGVHRVARGDHAGGRRQQDAGVVAEGEAVGLRHAGTKSLASLRMEKGYRAHGAELELDFDLVEAGMARPTVKAADFVGKAAYLAQRAKPPVAKPKARPASVLAAPMRNSN